MVSVSMVNVTEERVKLEKWEGWRVKCRSKEMHTVRPSHDSH